MRIISGKFKGRKLFQPKDETVRPTTDRIKESLFNILGQRMDNLSVLDLFSGSGALGIEALSRGAKSAVFCDKSRQNLALTKRNLEILGINCKLINDDYKNALKSLNGEKFDLIFCDPPYKENFLSEILKRVCENELLTENGIIVYESFCDNLINVEKPYIIKDSRMYGKIKLTFISKETQ